METGKRWAELSPAEKREERFMWWLSPPEVRFSSLTAERTYKARVQRFIDVYNVKEPNRVPVSLPVASMPAFNLHRKMECPIS